jgi:membrane-bound lytic murein transglycosylase D
MERRFKTPNIKAKNLIIFLLLTGINLTIVQADERPLRNVLPGRGSQTQIITPHLSSHTKYTLLTPENIAKPLTQRYITQYTSPSGVEYLNSVMERASIYMPFIMEEITKRNLPPELAYLPVIESSFIITARSRSGAVGLWQFMLNSIAPFDIKVNDFVDERRDFIKSTRGALAKLEDNYRTLGSWELALAAYNAGLGAITRMIQRTGVNDYWELGSKKELRQETEHYVPKLIAATYVLSQPRRFGINAWYKPLEWTSIPLERQISLDILADEAGINKELLRQLNAQLLHGISPVDKNFLLVVPTAHLEDIYLVLEREDLRLIRYYYHVVRHGDTLWSMSRHYGTPLNMIEDHNPGVSSRYLKIGETIIIPAFNDVMPVPRLIAAQNFNGNHVVSKGETLWSLSRKYGVTPEALAEANDMTLDQILREGRTLKVPIIN